MMDSYKRTVGSSAKQRLQQVIKAFQDRLEDKIKDVCKSMMGESKIMNCKLPAIEKSEQSTIQSNTLSNYHLSMRLQNKDRKSMSYNLTKISEAIKSNTDLDEARGSMRAVGTQKFKKPKKIERKPDILPRHIRDNPFAEPLPVSINDISKGVINLMNKGIIAKDVDISTAFDRGQPPMRMRTAILHHFQQKTVKQIELESARPYRLELPRTLIKESPMADKPSHGWAITGLESDSMAMRATHQQSTRKKQKHEDFKDLTIYHLEFKSSKILETPSYISLRTNEALNWGGIRSIIREIQKLLKKYEVLSAFADGRRILAICLSPKKPTVRMLLQCMIGDPLDKRNLFSIKNIKSQGSKLKLGAIVISSAMRMNILRKQFVDIQKRKLNQFKIVNWISQKIIKTRYRMTMNKKREEQERLFDVQQQQFIDSYSKIKLQKHFQIHVPNFKIDLSKDELFQKNNIEITRIFNLKDSNVHIVYVCPFVLSPDITNYYYKILELGEVSNYKGRVTFLECDPKNYFRQRFENSKKLYYCSETLRKLKEIIGGCPAYFVTSQPTYEDMCLSLYMKIPLMIDCHMARELSMRDISIVKFKELELQTMSCLRIDKSIKCSISELIIKMGRFAYESHSRKLIIKINNTSNSCGLAVVNLPINNLDDLYGKTVSVNSSYYYDTKAFYHDFLREGGVIQKVQMNFAPITASIFVPPGKPYELLGTFDKINNNYSNIGYSFPQQSIFHEYLIEPLDKLMDGLTAKGYYGYLDVNLYVDSNKNIFFQKITCGLTKVAASFFYFRYLMNGRFENNGKYTTNVSDTIVLEDINGQQLEKIQTRTYIYSPFVLHMGLSPAQMKNFFQLCRIEGISFDLEKKYGSTFILLQTLKSCVGLMTTGKTTRTSVKLMTTTLGFLLKQNQKVINDINREKELRFKEKCNILSIKSRYEELLSLLKTEQQDK